MGDVMADEDLRNSSRKWRLAVASLALATMAAVTLSGVISVFLWKGFLTEEIWIKAMMGVLYWWLFADGMVLGGYGFVNVIEKWAPRVPA